jgi:hypothetical protein
MLAVFIPRPASGERQIAERRLAAPFFVPAIDEP